MLTVVFCYLPVRRRALDSQLVRERRELKEKINIHIHSWFIKREIQKKTFHKIHDTAVWKCQQINQFCIEWLNVPQSDKPTSFIIKLFMLSTLLAAKAYNSSHSSFFIIHISKKKKVNQLKSNRIKGSFVIIRSPLTLFNTTKHILSTANNIKMKTKMHDFVCFCCHIKNQDQTCILNEFFEIQIRILANLEIEKTERRKMWI